MAEPQQKTITVYHNFGFVTLNVISTVYDPLMESEYCLATHPSTHETVIALYYPRVQQYYVIEQGPRNDLLNKFLRIVIEGHALDPIGFPWVIK